MKLLQAINDVWAGFSPRERYLAVAVLSLVLLMAAMMTYRSAVGRIDSLEDSIERLHQDIVNGTYQIALKENVEEEYSKVAMQHSSKWTEAEIHDRLRQELYRLAQKVPPELDENGIPMKTSGGEGDLVKIPVLQQGTLRDSGEDFREYTISLRIPPVDLPSLVAFLQRLQNSPQSLRIDALDIYRSSLDKQVSADLDITRIITAGAPEEAGDEGKAETGTPLNDTLDPANWTCEGGDLTKEEGAATGPVLAAQAKADGMELWLTNALAGRATYDVFFDAQCTGKGYVRISAADKAAFPEKEPLRQDGKLYRYHLQFTTPDAGSAQTRINAPHFVVESNGAKLKISKFSIEKTSE